MYSRHGYGSYPGQRVDKSKPDRVKKITKNPIAKKEKYKSGIKDAAKVKDSDDEEDKDDKQQQAQEND